MTSITDILDINISCFENVCSTDSYTISLQHWLKVCTQGCKHLSTVKAIRKNGALELKKKLPVISPGALMHTRKRDVPDEKKIINKTGLLQFDIDCKDNPHIGCAADLRNQVGNIVFVAFASLSVSGNGVWGLVKVANPNCIKEHFQQLIKDFHSRNIILDPSKGGNATDLRIYSYDPKAYRANELKIYDRLHIPEKRQDPKIKRARQAYTPSLQQKDTQSKVEAFISLIQKGRIDITRDYEGWLKLGFALEDEFGEVGRHYFHQISQFHPDYNQKEADKQYDHCLRSNSSGNRITIATFFHFCKEFNIDI